MLQFAVRSEWIQRFLLFIELCQNWNFFQLALFNLWFCQTWDLNPCTSVLTLWLTLCCSGEAWWRHWVGQVGLPPVPRWCPPGGQGSDQAGRPAVSGCRYHRLQLPGVVHLWSRRHIRWVRALQGRQWPLLTLSHWPLELPTLTDP